VHPDAVLRVEFQRTLRIPDDGREYPLPPGLGPFPLRHVDDFARRVPEAWLRRGGVMLPMYQAEALWLRFDSRYGYPFAVKVAAGRVNAVTGGSWDDALHASPQDYVVVPDQPWLDGYVVREGLIRQFVAMPLGAGYTAEEQLTGGTDGGIQLLVHPFSAAAWERLARRQRGPGAYAVGDLDSAMLCMDALPAPYDMGLGAGGQMRQEIYEDEHPFEEWETGQRGRVFVHLANSLVWRDVTGEAPPAAVATAEQYTRAGLPWFEYYDADRRALEGSSELAGLKTVKQVGEERGEAALRENVSVDPSLVVGLRAGLAADQVREGAF
jgi:hypothetical protein